MIATRPGHRNPATSNHRHPKPPSPQTTVTPNHHHPKPPSPQTTITPNNRHPKQPSAQTTVTPAKARAQRLHFADDLNPPWRCGSDASRDRTTAAAPFVKGGRHRAAAAGGFASCGQSVTNGAGLLPEMEPTPFADFTRGAAQRTGGSRVVILRQRDRENPANLITIRFRK
jgi:hypothetical protein